MFLRLRSGLPKDPVFAKDLKGLGYFINEKDEIRSIENPKAYFTCFLSKNERYNEVQREGMNEAIRNIIAERLQALGLAILRLPLGALEMEPHVPIFISKNLNIKKQIIVLFYEAVQDLGVFAYRVAGGKGGLSAGSAVDFVKYILSSSSEKDEVPGIIIANLGQLTWSHRAKKAMTFSSWFALPRVSAADPPYDIDPFKNTIEGNRSTFEHVSYLFNNILGNPDVCDQDSKIQIIGVSQGAVDATMFLHDPNNFSRWCLGIEPVEDHGWRTSSGVENRSHKAVGEDFYKGRVTGLASLAPSVTVPQKGEIVDATFKQITNAGFKGWFEKRGRAFVISDEPAGQFLAPPGGHKFYQAFGAPTFSLGEPHCTEKLLIVGHKTVLDWLEEGAANPSYANPTFTRMDVESEEKHQQLAEGEAELWIGSPVIQGAKQETMENVFGKMVNSLQKAVVLVPSGPLQIPGNSSYTETDAVAKQTHYPCNSYHERPERPKEFKETGLEKCLGMETTLQQ